MSTDISFHNLVERGNFEDVLKTLHTITENDTFDINILDDCGYSPLHIASHHGYDMIVDLLLQCGADPWLYTNDGNSNNNR